MSAHGTKLLYNQFTPNLSKMSVKIEKTSKIRQFCQWIQSDLLVTFHNHDIAVLGFIKGSLNLRLTWVYVCKTSAQMKRNPFVNTLDKAFANCFLKDFFSSELGYRMTQSPTGNSAVMK